MWPTFRVVSFVLLVALYVARRRRSRHPSNIPLPPGPKGFPLLGAALSIDTSQPWLTYFQWRKLYGDLVYTRIFNMNVLVINSAKVAHDLVELRSNIYSDRPRFVTAGPYGTADGTILLPYGDMWRLHRRIYHQAMNSEAAVNYRPMQCEKARQLIANLAEDPRHFSAHLHTYSTSIIMSIVYGYDTARTNDPYVEYAERGMKAMSKAADSKTTALLGMFPFLLNLPTWVPGSFKAEAAEATYYSTGFSTVLFELGLERMTSAPSMIGDAIRRNESNGNIPDVALAIRNTSSTAYGAASETTSATLDVFVLAMVLFPEAQRRAQEELDTVIGSNRLPDFDDRPSLPFVEAVLLETLRWNPIAPLAVPHATTTDHVYEGTYIPKGTTVFVNSWGIAHDEKTYSDPFEFKPERFIQEDGTVTGGDASITFGFGRRICPGQYVAHASLWIAVVSMLATFNFLRDQDVDGKEIDFSPQFQSEGAVSRPKHFPCRIVPRVSLVRRIYVVEPRAWGSVTNRVWLRVQVGEVAVLDVYIPI